MIELVNADQVSLYIVKRELRKMDGLGVIRRIRNAYTDSRVLVLSGRSDANHICASIRAGASGYLLKEEVNDLLLKKIATLESDDFAISGKAISMLVEELSARRHVNPVESISAHRVGPREIDVLELLSDGHPIDPIANRQHISKHTVNQHLRNIYRKVKIHSRSMTVHVTLSDGLLNHRRY